MLKNYIKIAFGIYGGKKDTPLFNIFGLAALTKEIGIRKVLCATVSGIVKPV